MPAQEKNKRGAGTVSEETKKLKHSFYLTFFWVLLLLAVVSGTTYAWFTLNGRSSVNVTPTGGTVSEGDTVLLISNSESGPFDKSCELRLSGDPESLKPLSTADLTSFYQATAQDHEGIAVRYRDLSAEVDKNVLHGTVYLQCRYAPCDVYFDRNELKLGTDAQALAAMRLGLKITTGSGSMTYLLKLDDMGAAAGAEAVRTVPGADTVVSSVNGDGQAVYTADPAQEIAGFFAVDGAEDGSYEAGSKRLCSLGADEVAAVEYWLYLEGCDDHCSNPVQNRSSAFALAFAGVSAEAEQKGGQS